MKIRTSFALGALPLILCIAACGSSPHQETVETVDIPAPAPPPKETNIATDNTPPPSEPPPPERREEPAPSQPAPPMKPVAASTTTQARQRALVVTELQALTQTFSNTGQNTASRPTLLRRIAEDYVELENAAIRDQDLAVEQHARAEAIRSYAMLENDYPQYAQLDEVLYFHARESEAARDLTNARRTYYVLIQRFPTSKYVPNAYLGFGEMFFDEAANDPSKLPLAEQAYKEVLKYPPPTNTVYGYASYKLAYVSWNKGDYPAALASFKRTIDFGAQYAQIGGAAKLADTARKDIAFVYAKSGDPQKAYNFFHPMSGDVAGSSDHTFAMMGNLGKVYLDTGAFKDAQTLYRDLGARDAAHKCRWDAHLHYATRAAGGSVSRADLDADLARCPSA